MADITITGATIRVANTPRIAGWLYFFPMSDFWLQGHRTPLTASSPYNGGTPYMRVALTPTGSNPTVFTYASFSIPSTEDATINSNGARWGAFIFDDSNVPRLISHVAYLETFCIPSSPTTHNLQDLAGYQTTSFPPVTDGDRVILGDLYAVDGFFSGTVTAVQFVGGGAGLTGVTGATGGISNTGSTTIAADTDVDGVGIISLQTRTIERVQIANDGALNALFAFNATGLSTLAGGAQFNATQAKWSTGNIGAPSTSDQNQGSREIYYPATLGEHFARGVASGTLWDNVSLAGAYRRYFGADVINSITETNDQCLIQSDSALYTYEFQFGEDNPAILKWSVSGFPLQPSTFQWELDAAAIMELGAGALFPSLDDTTDFGKVAKRWQDGYFTRLHVTEGQFFEFALSDETTAITTGTAKLTWRAPFAFTVVSVRASLATASSSGIPTVDINDGGTTILSTKLTIDASEKTSTTAAVPAVISDTAIASDAEVTFDVDVAGTGAMGLKVKIFYTV